MVDEAVDQQAETVGALHGMSVDGLTYELINKRFRNAVLSHCRECLIPVLGQSLDEDIQALYQKEWEQIIRSIDVAAAGGVRREVRDALDYLSVTHFHVLFEKYFRDLVPADAIPNGEAEKAVRKRFFTWLAAIKDVRHPNAHPAEEDLSVFDALMVADSACRVLTILGRGDDIADVEQLRKVLLTRATRADDADGIEKSLAFSTLPARETVYDQFVGRTDELEALWRWFSDDRSRRWVLVGDGGKGKSAIAYQFAESVLRANPDETAGVFWLSAKKRRFEDSEVIAITRPDFWDLDSALDRLLRDFGDAENVDKTLDAKRDVVLQLMSDFPSLIVVDDIDSIEEAHEDVVEFFTFEAARTESKVLLTSRRRYPGMGRSSTVVNGLSRDDARLYLVATAERLGLVVDEALDRSFNKIYEATDGSPLYMEDLLRLCRQLRLAEAVDRWRQQGGDAARRYALEREYSLLSSSARAALDATCWARQPLSVAQVETILNVDEDSALGAIQELESRFLVPAPEIVEGVPAFRAHRNLEVLVRRDLRSDPSKLALRNAVESVLRISVGDRGDADVARQVSVRLRSGRMGEALEVAEAALVSNPSSPGLLALRAEVLTRQRPPRMADARQDWRRAADLGMSRAESYWHWAEAEQRASDWRRMFDAAELGLSRGHKDDAYLNALAGYAASRVGQTHARGLDRETAQVWLERAEEYLRQAVNIGRRERASDQKLGRWYRNLIVNAQAFSGGRRDTQVVYWVLQWLKRCPDSPEARAEAVRQSPRYAPVREALSLTQTQAP